MGPQGISMNVHLCEKGKKKKSAKKEKGEQVFAGWCTAGVIFLLFEVDARVFLACGCSRLGALH